MAGETAAEILEKDGRKLESEINIPQQEFQSNFSEEYARFKREMSPELSRYERWANSLGNLIKIRVAERDRVKVQRHLDIAHLEVSAGQALTLALISLLGVFFLTLLIAAAIFFIQFPEGLGSMTSKDVSNM